MSYFFAVDPAHEARARVRDAMEQVKLLAPTSRWSDDDKLHITLVFLGDLDATGLARMTDALTETAARHRSFELDASGAGTFGATSSPVVLWMDLGRRRGRAALGALASELRGAAVAAGVRVDDRPYAPHLTLARSAARSGDAGLARAALALELASAGSFEVSHATLYESARGVYSVIASATLSGG